MFGYVIINQQALCEEATARYQASYCGLCHALGDLHGLGGRLALSYDLTFLNLLLASLYEDEHPIAHGMRRCPTHPLRKRTWRSTHETNYCADMSIALHYYAAKDKWQDDKSPAGLGFMLLLDRRRKAAEARYPTQCAAMVDGLARLAAFEAENSQDLEAVSSCFGEIMAAIFDMKADHWANDLRAIGFYLGKYIYLLDAYDDLAKDKKKGNYNPLTALSKNEEYESMMREILQHLMGLTTQHFSRLPCLADLDLLENILYSGVWLRYDCKQSATHNGATEDETNAAFPPCEDDCPGASQAP